MNRKVLLVEDEEPLCRVVARNLTARGHEVAIAGTAAAALAELAAGDFDLMLLDIDLPDRTGWEVVRELRASGRDVPFVVVSAVRINPEQLAEFEPLAYLPKPFPLDALLRIVTGLDSPPESDDEPADEADAPAPGSLDEYDRQVEAARRAATMPDLLQSEFEQRFAELAAHVIVPAMNEIEGELVDRGHRAELVEERHASAPTWRSALVALTVIPGDWDETEVSWPRISFVSNAERQLVEVHSWIARPGGDAEGRRRSTLTVDELTREVLDRELRTFVDEVFGGPPTADDRERRDG